MSLREHIAEKLVNFFAPRVSDALPYERLASWQQLKWLELADEVIRLMEWARQECTGEHWAGEGWDGTRYLVDRSERPLTCPPDDWRPE